MRTSILRAYAIGAITGTIVTAGLAVATAPMAKADARSDAIICEVLDDYPSIEGVIGIGLALQDEGYSAYNAGVAIAEAVVNECPEHTTLMRRFIAIYSSDTDSTVA